MDLTLLFSMFGFAAISAITPGPNNILLMSSGALYGWRRTMPHLIGVQIGFQLMMLMAVFGLGILVLFLPWLVPISKILGAGWLSWMGVQFLRAAWDHSRVTSKPKKAKVGRPFKLYEAVLFQWVNPKAYIMCLSASGAYIGLSSSTAMRALVIGAVFTSVGLFASMVWMLAGDGLNKYLTDGRRATVFNLVMGLLLFLTAAIIVGYSPKLPT